MPEEGLSLPAGRGIGLQCLHRRPLAFRRRARLERRPIWTAPLPGFAARPVHFSAAPAASIRNPARSVVKVDQRPRSASHRDMNILQRVAPTAGKPIQSRRFTASSEINAWGNKKPLQAGPGGVRTWAAPRSGSRHPMRTRLRRILSSLMDFRLSSRKLYEFCRIAGPSAGWRPATAAMFDPANMMVVLRSLNGCASAQVSATMACSISNPTSDDKKKFRCVK
jgi:hypothetical protein